MKVVSSCLSNQRMLIPRLASIAEKGTYNRKAVGLEDHSCMLAGELCWCNIGRGAGSPSS